MARQTGIIKLKGTLGDLTFYKSGGQYLVRQKSSLDRKRIATDPAFQRTRENGAEFGCAGRAGRVLRTAIRPLLGVAKDRFVTQRLTSALVRVLQADRVNPRGLRNVIDGDAELLTGFEFNRNAALGTTLHAPYRTDMDRQQGTLTLSVDPFVPSQRVVAPSGATHFKIVSAGTEIDFEGETFTTDCKETGYLPWDHDVTEAIVHVHQVTAGSVHPLFLVVGIVFFQEVNGVYYPLSDEAFNALRVAAVSGGGKVEDVGGQSKEELSAVEASGGFSSFVLTQTKDQANSVSLQIIDRARRFSGAKRSKKSSAGFVRRPACHDPTRGLRFGGL